jgi:hypothetical protein
MSPAKCSSLTAASTSSEKLQTRQLCSDFLGRDQVPLLIAHCVKAHCAVHIDNKERRLLTKGDEPRRNVVGVEYLSIGIGNNLKRVRVLRQVLLQRVNRIGSNRHDLAASGQQRFMGLTQLRKVLAAVRSKEAPKKHQNDRGLRPGVV